MSFNQNNVDLFLLLINFINKQNEFLHCELSDKSFHEQLSYNGLKDLERKASQLSRREHECIYLSLRGKTAKEIGKLLSLSFRTVEDYLNNAKSKLGCLNKRDLIALYKIISIYKF